MPPQRCSHYSDNKSPCRALQNRICFLNLSAAPTLKDFILAEQWKAQKTSMWLSRIRRKSHIPSLYHIPSTSPICMVQILGLKREIRIAFSWNGRICLLKWNRNVIWNQCIRTCPDISTVPLHTLALSLFVTPSLYVSRSFCKFPAHHNRGVEEQAWIKPKCKAWLCKRRPLTLGPPWK